MNGYHDMFQSGFMMMSVVIMSIILKTTTTVVPFIPDSFNQVFRECSACSLSSEIMDVVDARH